MIPQEPQSASNYDDRTTTAVKAVLVEMGQILGSFKGRFAIVGGAVPWLLLGNEDMPHVGTLDVDIGLDAEALGDGEYARLVEILMANGYRQQEGLRRFQLVRRISVADGAAPIGVVVDFLMSRTAKIVKNVPPLVGEFAVQRADGVDLAMCFNQLITITGPMPTGGNNRVEIAVCSIPALLAMKGHAVNGRHKQKDAYDIYYCVRNYPGGIGALADDSRPILVHPSGEKGFRYIAEKFDAPDGYGPTSVRLFFEDTHRAGDRTPDQWQQDAFGQVDALLRSLGLR